MNRDQLDELMTDSEVAAFLRISTRKLRTLISAGDAPAYSLVGKVRRWRKSDVDAWIREQSTSAPSGDPGEGKRKAQPFAPHAKGDDI